jgi:rSAM/selenodomain-associated transferase 1
MHRHLFILIAKAPIAGRVKTRLCPPLAPEEASSLHTAFVADMGRMLLTMSEMADFELSTDVETDAWPALQVPRRVQPEGDLGTRLLQALQQGLSSGREVVTVLASDSPGLPSTHLLELLRSNADVTLGPTSDGGFFGIACRAVHQDMFAGVRWSCEHTLTDVIAAASASGLSVETGPSWFDVDVEADLLQLLNMPQLPEYTASWVRSYQKR